MRSEYGSHASGTVGVIFSAVFGPARFWIFMATSFTLTGAGATRWRPPAADPNSFPGLGPPSYAHIMALKRVGGLLRRSLMWVTEITLLPTRPFRCVLACA